jgi:hypothetical protein
MQVSRFTDHARLRIQQRGIPIEIAKQLVSWGDKIHDRNGGVVRFFSQRSLKKLKARLDPDLFQLVVENKRCYLIESANDGTVITVGKRYSTKKIKR